MTEHETINYNRIAAAIEDIKDHFKEQPGIFDCEAARTNLLVDG